MKAKKFLLKNAWVLTLALFAASCSSDDDNKIVDIEPEKEVKANPTVATVNFAAKWGDKASNLASMIAYIEDAEAKDVDILLFPELALTGYSESSSAMVGYSESVDGASALAIAQLADKYDMYVAYGAPETSSDTSKAYNSMFVCTPEGEVDSYQSISTKETWSVEGNSLKTIDTPWGKVGLTVGVEALEMPEIGRIYTAKDCYLILNATSIEVDDYETTIPSTAVYDQFSKDYYAPTSEEFFRVNLENNYCTTSIFWAYANLKDGSADVGKDFIESSLIIGPSLTYPDKTQNNKYDYLSYHAGSIGSDSSDLIYATIDKELIGYPYSRSSLFQPELYTAWYANIQKAADPTESSNPVCAVVNMNPEWANKEANYQMMLNYMEDAKMQGVDIIVFPELALADYVSTSDEESYKWQAMIDNAETVTGEYATKLLEKAIEMDMYVIYGTSEVNPDDAKHPYNSAFVASPVDKKTYSYQKIHPVEGEWCAWGTEPLIVETPWGGMGISVCKDSYSYPELGRYYAMSGCKLVINPTASGSYAGKDFLYNSAISTMASRDRMIVLSSDLVGPGAASDEDWSKTIFPGKSVIIGQSGTSAVYYNEMSMVDEALYVATPDMSETGLDASTVRADVLSAEYAAL